MCGKKYFAGTEHHRHQFLRDLRIKWQLGFSFDSYARIYIQRKIEIDIDLWMKNIGAWVSAAQWESSSVQIKWGVKKHAKTEQNMEIILLK